MSMAGRMLRYGRRRAGLTQRQLAAKSGIPQETIARIERGRSDPRIGTLDRLLEAVDLGLEVMPRLGIGIDRTQFPGLLALTPGKRLEWSIDADRAMLHLRQNLRRVAE